MSERNRRRERASGDSEGLSESSFDGVDVNKGSEGEADPNVSSEGQKSYEYDETVDNDGEDSRSDCTPPRDGDEGDSDSIIIEYEREEGDGQESVPAKEKKLDDDEDRRNPQYIPKRGTFYEHDDRTVTEDVDEEVVDKESERAKEIQNNDKKKVWKENENRWSHDRYNEDEQTPKSRDELVAIYGYDIRNEEAPPRARRRRRYGRGPNKYTRNWEDEDAYTKTAAALGLRGGRRGGAVVGRGGRRNTEEFPPLQQNQQQQVSSQSDGEERISDQHIKSKVPGMLDKKVTQIRNEERNTSSTKDGVPLTVANSNVWKKDTNQNNLEHRKEEIPQKSLPPTWKTSQHLPAANKNQATAESEHKEENTNKWKGTGANRGRGRGICDVHDSNLMVGGDVGRRPRGRATSRAGHSGRGPVTHQLSSSGDGRSLSETRMSSHDEGSSSESGGAGYQIQSQVITRTQDDASKEFSQLSLNEQRVAKDARRLNKIQPNFHQNPERRQTVVPPRMQQENAANRPKRYSSQRQRSLPESNGPTYAQQPHGYYSPGYVQQPVYADAPPPAPQQPPPPPPPQPAPMLPPTYPPPYASPTAYMQPVPPPPPPRILQAPHGPPPGPYVQPPPPTAPIINYIPAPAQGQFPPQGFPAFQGYAPVAPGQPPELFQAQGITYYSPEEQVMSRPPPVAQKRQRAAIPIVPPPEGMTKGRGRLRDRVMSPSPDPGAAMNYTMPAVHQVQAQEQEGSSTSVLGQYADPSEDSTIVSNTTAAENIVTANTAIEQEVRS